MSNIDCLVIGHNDVSIEKQTQLIRLNFGKDSTTFRERIKYNLAQIKFNNGLYSPLRLFHLLNKGGAKDVNTFSGIFNLATAWLCTALKNNNFSFDMINTFSDEKEKLSNILLNKKVYSIAITTTFYIYSYPLIEIIKFVKEKNKQAKIIIGGPYIYNQVNLLSTQQLQIFFQSIGADYYVFSSEGEKTLVELVRTIKYGSKTTINNVYYKDGDNYICSSILKEEKNLSADKINWTLFKHYLKGKIVNIQTSLSCPFNCSFCTFPFIAGTFRQAPVEVIEKQLNQLRKLEVKTVHFIDDTLNIPRNRFVKMLKMIIKNKYNSKWLGFIRCQYLDEEVTSLMKESGCIAVLCGLESANLQILNNMNKKSSPDEYERGLSLLHKHKIITVASFIIGFPGETEETFNDTYRFIERVKPTFYQARLWGCDNNSPIFKDKNNNFNINGSEYTWSHSTMNSETAFNYTSYLFNNVNNSIHITEYPILLNLLNEDINQENAINFLKYYSYLLRNELGKSYNNHDLYIEKINDTLHML